MYKVCQFSNDRKILHIIAITITLILIPLVSVFAQKTSAATDRQTTISAEQERPVNTDTKTDRNVLTAEDIRMMKVTKIQELLDKIPGVTANGPGVTIRGSREVLVIVDGRTINDPISGGIKWDQISLTNIERIEVIQGGGSAEYGENSSGGVVLITSKTADKLSGSLEAYAGNDGVESYSAEMNTGYGKLHIGTLVGYYSNDGFRANEDKETKRAGVNLSYALSDDIVLSPSINYFKEKRGLGGPVFAPTLYNRVFYDSFTAILVAETKLLNSKTYFGDMEDRSTDSPLSPSGHHDISVGSKTYSQEFTTEFSLTESGKLSAGVGYEYCDVDVERDIHYVPYEPENHTEKKGWLYATYRMDPEESPYSFYLGLRGIYYSEFDNALNPEISLGYDKEKYGAIIGFNMTDNIPSFKQRYFQDALFIANPDLGKESSMNYSLSIHYNPISSITIHITPFYSIVDDIFVVNPVDGGVQHMNVGKATLTGVDTSITWKPKRGYYFDLSHGYLEAKDDETGKYLTGQSKHIVQAKAIVTPFEPFSVSITGSYQSKEYSNAENTISVDGYYEVDCRLEYEYGNYVLFGQVDNLFDEEHTNHFFIPGWPRTWFVGARYSF